MAEAANYSAIRHRKAEKRRVLRLTSRVAVGWYARPKGLWIFGRCLCLRPAPHVELKVPVGIIDCARGGTPIEPYVPASASRATHAGQLAKYAKAGDLEAIRKMPVALGPKPGLGGNL